MPSAHFTTQALIARLEKDEKNIGKAELAYDRTLKKLRKVCQHEHVSRCEFDGLSPTRICEDCGLEESEWDVSCNSLNGRLYHQRAVTCNRNDLYKFRKRE